MSVPASARSPGLAAALLVGLCACVSSSGSKRGEFDRRLRERTVDYVFSRVDRYYPYLGRVDVDWGSTKRAARRAAVEAPTRGDFVREMGRALSVLEDPHLSLELPFDSIDPAGEAWTVPFIELAWIEGRLHVTRWAEGEQPGVPATALTQPAASGRAAAARHRLPAPELIAIDGCPPSAGLLSALLAGPPETTVELGLGWPDGSTSTHRVTRLAAGRTPSRPGAFGRGLDHHSWISWARLDTLGYLHVQAFSPSQVHVPTERMVADIASAFEALEGVDALILDLQYNSGGNLYIGGTLAEYLVPETTLLGVLHDHWLGIFPWKRKFVLQPRPEGYRGPLVVLVNGQTASMAEHVARALRRSGRARVIGETTAGAEAAIRRFEAPDGSVLTFGEQRMTWSDGSGFQGVGLVPDVQIPLTIEDVRREGFGRARARVQSARLRAALTELGSALPVERVPHPPHPGRLVPHLPAP